MKIINCLDNNPSLILAEAYRLIGQSYTEMQLFDQSIENYQKIYEIFLSLKNENCLYRSLFDLGRSLLLAKKYLEAIEIFLQMLNKSINDIERAFVYQYLSICYLNLNDFNQAKKYAYQSIDYALTSNEEILSIEGNILLGEIYFQLKDLQHAEEYFLYAQNLKDKLIDSNQIKYLDELINNIKNSKKQISSLIQNKTNEKISNWRILTPYYHLFDIFCS